MNKSENINELSMDKIIPALINIQREVTNIGKNADGYGYKYAKLESVLNMLRPIFNKHDVLIWQDAAGEDGDKTTITTEFVHSSGQSKKQSITVNIPQLAKMNSLQSLGSVISYIRRYHLMMMIGIAGTEDDDGKAGGEHIDASRDDLKKAVMDCVLAGTFSQENMQAALTHYKVKGIDDLSAQQLQAILTRVNRG